MLLPVDVSVALTFKPMTLKTFKPMTLKTSSVCGSTVANIRISLTSLWHVIVAWRLFDVLAILWAPFDVHTLNAEAASVLDLDVLCDMKCFASYLSGEHLTLLTLQLSLTVVCTFRYWKVCTTHPSSFCDYVDSVLAISRTASNTR